MKLLRQILPGLSLVLVLSIPAFAGEISTPGLMASESPGITADIHTPGFTGETQGPGITGETQTPPGIRGDVSTPGMTGNVLIPGLRFIIAGLF